MWSVTIRSAIQGLRFWTVGSQNGWAWAPVLTCLSRECVRSCPKRMPWWDQGPGDACAVEGKPSLESLMGSRESRMFPFHACPRCTGTRDWMGLASSRSTHSLVSLPPPSTGPLLVLSPPLLPGGWHLGPQPHQPSLHT